MDTISQTKNSSKCRILGLNVGNLVLIMVVVPVEQYNFEVVITEYPVCLYLNGVKKANHNFVYKRMR